MISNPDIIVIGAGHAGCEAALAAARLGCEVLVITMSLDTIAQMSCNPAIGGLAKGQLVREIDALGGAMGMAIDATGIQFRMLNTSKGAAVRSPRAQADKWAYQHWMKHYLEQADRVHLLQDRVVEVKVEGSTVVGVVTALGLEIPTAAVIVATGTFPCGKTHIGKSQASGGRFGEPAAEEISRSLELLGLPVMRLKTGTCPRLNARTVDFSKLEPQPGDEPPKPFSYLTEKLELEQVPCYATWTTETTLDVARKACENAPVFTGQIQGIGPRYCPSFEIKVTRFPDRKRHHIYLEPEGRRTEELYINGLTTSVDTDSQIAMVRSIPGLAEAEITRFGYAVEYDAVPPRVLRETLEAKKVSGLFCAGQINGTSGYEEAAAQGLIAGANAALKIQNRPPLLLRRDQAYIGVLVDDLVTRGTEEPYRLFTSRAEYRLMIRQDNADLRLTRLAADIGLVENRRAIKADTLQQEIDEALARISRVYHAGRSIARHLKNPETTWSDVLSFDPELKHLSARAAEQVEIETAYEGYISRHLTEMKRVKQSSSRIIPEDFDYRKLGGLRLEAIEKLESIRPETIGQAGKISGVSPADVALLLVRVTRHRGCRAPA